MPPTKKRQKTTPARAAGKAPRTAAKAETALLPSVESLIETLRRAGSAKFRDQMVNQFGIRLPDQCRAFGVSVAVIEKLAKTTIAPLRKHPDGPAMRHGLAAELWASGWYDARMLATFVDVPDWVTARQMDDWCGDFDNWGIVDTACFKLFDQVEAGLVFRKIDAWAKAKGEFQKRAAFALLASVALHRRGDVDDGLLAERLPLIEQAATDERNFVKKGVSWALRSMGARRPGLRGPVLAVATRLAESDDSTSRWIGKDVLRGLRVPGSTRSRAQ